MQLVDQREQVWQRLARLLDRVAKRGLSSLGDSEVEDLGKLYRASATHLALLRGFGASARKLEHLNALVSRAHGVFYGRPVKRKRHLVTRVILGFPALVRKTAIYHLAAFLILVLSAVYGYMGTAADPDWALEFAVPGDNRTPYADRDELLAGLEMGRAGEMVAAHKAMFASLLWQNNTRVALLAFFLGVVFGIPTVLLLMMNGIMLGCYTYTFHSHGLAYEWWAWILPHGITEILAIVLLAGGGLWIGKLMIAPGEDSRVNVFRNLVPGFTSILLFAFPMLLVAALIESFVRQSSLGNPGRYVFAGVSLLFWVVFFRYARMPRSVAEEFVRQRSVAEQAVPLPEDEEFLVLVGAKGRRPTKPC